MQSTPNTLKQVNAMEGYIRDCIKGNGDKTQMQSTHYNTLRFMGVVMT